MTTTKGAGRATVPAPDTPTMDNSPSSDATFATVHANLISIKKEIDRGTPVDPAVIADLEAALARLENEAKRLPV
jgi:hypothetical protein